MNKHTHRFSIASEAELAQFAASVAKQLRCGDLIRLNGDLGAGKSSFARALIQALGNKGDVPSPTYTLMQTYVDGRLPVAHLDCYRLNDPDELQALDLQLWHDHGVIVAEWPDKGGDFLRSDQPDLIDYHSYERCNAGVLDITITTTGETNRDITLECKLAWWLRLTNIFKEIMRPTTPEGRLAFLQKAGFNISADQLTPASGSEAFSTRTYWRFDDNGTSRILMDAAPPAQDNVRFADVAGYLGSKGFHTVEIDNRSDIENGYLILNDLGSTPLKSKLIGTSEEETEAWSKLALDYAVQFANTPVPTHWRSYGKTELWIELLRMINYYLPLMRGKAMTPEETEHFYQIWQPLFDKILNVPQGMMHFDFHGDNILLRNDTPTSTDAFALIDFQDAALGPVTYDAASFIWNDRHYVEAPQRAKLIDYYCEKTGMDKQQFLDSAELITIQRAMKNMGGVCKWVALANRTDLLKVLPNFTMLPLQILPYRQDCAALYKWWQENVEPYRNKETSLAA